jgi:hypothetical protein
LEKSAKPVLKSASRAALFIMALYKRFLKAIRSKTALIALFKADFAALYAPARLNGQAEHPSLPNDYCIYIESLRR